MGTELMEFAQKECTEVMLVCPNVSMTDLYIAGENIKVLKFNQQLTINTNNIFFSTEEKWCLEYNWGNCIINIHNVLCLEDCFWNVFCSTIAFYNFRLKNENNYILWNDYNTKIIYITLATISF